MAFSVKNTRNTEIDTIANNVLKTTNYGIRIPGKNFSGYGEAIAQTLLHILENHAAPNDGNDNPNPSNPAVDLSSPVDGQLWYDTSNRKLRVYDSVDAAWVVSSGAAAIGTSPPSSPAEGDLWWNTNTDVDQLFAYDGANWLLVGPSSRSGAINRTVDLVINTGGTGGLSSGDGAAPTGGTNTQAVGVLIENTLVGVWSNTAVASPTYYYSPLNNGTTNVRYYSFDPFGTSGILIGLNIGENTSNFWFNGKAQSALSADQLAGSASTNFMRRDSGSGAATSRQPATSGLDIGASGNPWGVMYATTFNGTATAALYSDLAERYESDVVLEEGDVVRLGGAKEVTKTTSAKDEDVFGVVSTKPGLALNEAAGDQNTHPYIALAGRVPVKILGPVSKGQRLVTSNIPGVAMAAGLNSEINSFMVIGRALEDKNSSGVGLVESVVLVGK